MLPGCALRGISFAGQDDRGASQADGKAGVLMMTRRAFVLLNHPHIRLNGLEFGGDDATCPGMYADLCSEDPSSIGLTFGSCKNYDDDKCRRCWDKQISNKPAKKKSPPVTATFKQALDTYGAEAQTLMVMEEMAELQKELCKHARGAGTTMMLLPKKSPMCSSCWSR